MMGRSDPKMLLLQIVLLLQNPSFSVHYIVLYIIGEIYSFNDQI